MFYGNNGFASAQANTEGRNFSMPTRDLAEQVPRTEQIEKPKVDRLAGIIAHGDRRNAPLANVSVDLVVGVTGLERMCEIGYKEVGI